MKQFFLLCLLTFLMLASSLNAQTEKEYQYLITSLKSLAQQDNPKLAKEVKRKYPATENYLKTALKKAKKGDGQFSNKKLYEVYSKIKTLHFAVNNCPKLGLKPLKFLAKKHTKYRIRATEEYYLTGIKWLRKKDRESAKQALFHFKQVEKLKVNFRDNQKKIQQARNLAAYRVVIETDFSPLASQNLNVADFQKSLLQYFDNQVFEQPIQFLLPTDVKSENSQKPDHVLKVKFNHFAVGQTYLKADKTKVSAQTDYYAYQKRVKARGSFILKVVEYETEKEFVNQPLTDYYKWVSEWGICKGNTTELSNIQKRNCTLKEPQVPSENILFEEFCRIAYQKITANISSFYSEDEASN